MIKSKIAIGLAAVLMAPNASAAEYDGVVAHIMAKPGQRDALIEALRPLAQMEGLIDIVVAEDPENADGIWLTEIWESKELHDKAASGPVFTAAMVKMKPVMLSIDRNYKTRPIHGNRLK